MWIFSSHSLSSTNSSARRAYLGGFTIIELMVASAIIIVITTVILFRHERFNSATILRSLAYGVALSVRQAQLYGTAVRETSLGCSGNACFPSYGVYFKTGETTRYFLAADSLPLPNGNGTIATDGTEDISPPSPYSLNGGYQIKDFCAYTSSTAHCKSNDIITSYLTIRFVRPNPDALFVTDAGGTYTRACVELESPGESTRAIEITNTGQISVNISGTTCAAL